MPDLTQIGVSGEGEVDFGGYQTVYYVLVAITSYGAEQRVVGTASPLGLWQAGEVMLGYVDDGTGATPAGKVVSYHWFVHHDYEVESVQAETLNPFEFAHMFWRFKPGVTANLYVQWTVP